MQARGDLRKGRTQYSLARQARTQYELSLHEKELTDWFAELLNEQRDSRVSLRDYLQDGSVLCRLMNVCRPGSIPKYNKPERSRAMQVYKVLDNVNRFLDICKENKFVSPSDLFLPQDLIEMQNFSQVLSCLLTVKKKIEEESRSESLVTNLIKAQHSPISSPPVPRVASPLSSSAETPLSPTIQVEGSVHESDSQKESQPQAPEPEQSQPQSQSESHLSEEPVSPPHTPPHQDRPSQPPPPPPLPVLDIPMVASTPKLSRGGLPSTNTMLGVIERRSEQLSSIKKQLESEKHNRALAEANVAQLQKQIEAISQRLDGVMRTRSESVISSQTAEMGQEIEKLNEQLLLEREQAKIKEREMRKQREDDRRIASQEREALNKKIQEMSLTLLQFQKQQADRDRAEKLRSEKERERREAEERDRLLKEQRDLEDRERIVREEREKFVREERERQEKEEQERKEREEEARKKLVDELRQQLAQEERERLEKEEKERWERELQERREKEEKERIERERVLHEIEERIERERREIADRERREREEREKERQEKEREREREEKEREEKEKEQKLQEQKLQEERESKEKNKRDPTSEEGSDDDLVGKYVWVKDREIWVDPSLILKWDDFNIIKRVNGGGYAEIFEAEIHGETVAVKRFIDKDPEKAKQELYNELYAFSILRSTNVVPVYGYCFDVPSIVMEYFHRGSLAFILWCENIKLPWNRRWIFTRDIAIGLNRMHCKKLLHCDVKSGNFLVRNDWKLLVSDFGCVRSTQWSSTEPFIGGTVNWTAPEVFDDKPYTEKADVYSFAMVMYEIATRKQPWYDLSDSPDSQLQIRRKVGSGDRPPLPSDTPAPYFELMKRCWAHNPEDRPTFTQILDFLELQGIDEEVSNHVESEDPESDNLQEELEMEKNMNAMYRRRIDELTAQLTEEQSTVSEMKRAALHMELKLEKAERDMRQFERLTAEMERMKNDSKHAARITDLEQQLDVAQKEFKKLEKKLERVESQKKRLEEDFEALVSKKPRERGLDDTTGGDDDRETRRSRRREERETPSQTEQAPPSSSEPAGETAEARRERRRKEKEQEENEEAEREKKREERRKAREERRKET